MALERSDFAAARRISSAPSRADPRSSRAHCGPRRRALREGRGGDRPVDSSRCSSIPQTSTPSITWHDAGARRTGGSGAPVPRAVPQDRPAGVLREGSEGSRGAAEALVISTRP